MDRKNGKKMKIMGRRHRLWVLFVIGFLGALAVATVGIFWYQSRVISNELIARDIGQLGAIFKRINDDCGIIGFEHERNYVDFLTVGSFVGSEVGAMNLKKPKNWHGPYVQDNPNVQEKLYEIVRTHKGYFLVPGAGVELSNKQIIGKDIVFGEDTDIYALVKDGVLVYNDQPLAMLIQING